MTSEADQQYRYRRGWWLRVVRRQKGMTLKQVAQAMGYSLRSQTTIKLWEDGLRDPADNQLRKIAEEVYGVPVEVFADPDPTDEERLAERIRTVMRERERRRRGTG